MDYCSLPPPDHNPDSQVCNTQSLCSAINSCLDISLLISTPLLSKSHSSRSPELFSLCPTIFFSLSLLSSFPSLRRRLQLQGRMLKEREGGREGRWLLFQTAMRRGTEHSSDIMFHMRPQAGTQFPPLPLSPSLSPFLCLSKSSLLFPPNPISFSLVFYVCYVYTHAHTDIRQAL